jgi:hypothetical protein
MIALIAAFAAILDYRQLNKQQKQFHDSTSNILQTIKENQAIQTQATKDYIACLLAINPAGNVKAQESVCFNKAPQVMQ